MTPSAISPMRRSSRTADSQVVDGDSGTVAEAAAVLDDTGVAVGAPERDTQRRRKGSLDRSGIQTRVGGRVPGDGHQHPADTGHGAGGCGGAQHGESGRDPVGHVVESGCGPTELAIARGAVTDHRIERVDGAISHEAGHSRHRAPPQRRHQRIGAVLRDLLDGGPGDLVSREARGVATHEVAHLSSRSVEVSGGELSLDRECLTFE